MAQRALGRHWRPISRRRHPGTTIRQFGDLARRQALAGISAFRTDPLQASWLLLWAPFWLGSVAPPARPRWLERPHADAIPKDPAGRYLTQRIDALTRNTGLSWVAGSMLRGVAIVLGLLIAWSFVNLISGGPSPSMLIAVIAIGVGLVVGAVNGILCWPTRSMVTRMLDRTFSLDERMVTAYERPASEDRLSRIQLADAANTIDEIAQEIPRSTWLPIREAVLCLVLGGAVIVTLLAGVSQQNIPTLESAPVPKFLTASERLAVREQPVQPPPENAPSAPEASIAEIQERGRESQATREDLGRLGEALASHPLTQPAAEAIADGDYGEASSLLQNASESISAMDQSERDALANDLGRAAQEMSETNPDLAQQTQETADALREGGPTAAESVRDLAEQIEQTGEQVESPDDLSRELDDAANNSGGSDASSEGSQGEQPSDGQSSSQQSGNESGANSDPGEGVSANPGVANQEQPGEPGAPSESGGGQGGSEDGAGSSASDDGSGQQPSDTASSGGASAPGASAGGEEGSQQSLSGAPDDETGASQGSGAGTGQSNANDQSSGGSVDDPAAPEENPDAEVPGAGEAGDPPPNRSDRGESDDGRGSSTTGTESLQLQGTSDEGVQSGGDSGTSSTGSGSDSSTASGDLEVGPASQAGPDSNRVPPALRDVVQEYFDGPEQP